MADNLTMTNLDVYLRMENFKKTKELDTKKLRRLLVELGLPPWIRGTNFIIEELKFYFEYDIMELNGSLDATYKISAILHKISVKKVRWNIQYALDKINIYGKEELIQEIFAWYDMQYNISPKNFFESMIKYMELNKEQFVIK